MASQTEAIGRLISLALRSNIPAEKVVRQLRGITCHNIKGMGPNKVCSCADAMAKALEDGEPEVIPMPRGACQDCGGTLEYTGGCNVCRDCGMSDCG